MTIDINNMKSISYAANWAEVDDITSFLDQGGDPNWTDAVGESLLSNVVGGMGPPGRRLKLAKMLLATGADPNLSKNLGRPLASGAMFSNVAMLKVLLDAGALINEVTELGCALHSAVKENKFENVQFLLEAGADPSLVDRDGLTPLALARKLKRKKLITLLESVPSDPSASART